MTFEDTLTQSSRSPVSKIVMTLDYCGLRFQERPCEGKGYPCYNTWGTCKDKWHYVRTSKDYVFFSARAPMRLFGARPYINEITYMPTEIKTSLTVNNRVKITMIDEPDGDVGVDQYVLQRYSIQGTFWKKFLARNQNYRGRRIAISEGFAGLPDSEFKPTFSGKIENIKLSGTTVSVECVDILKSLANIETPLKLGIKLASDIDTAATTIPISETKDLDDEGYILIGDEIIRYTSKDDATLSLSGATRGYWNTTIAAHSKKEKIQPVAYFPPTNPYDLMLSLLTDLGGIPDEDIDVAAFTSLKSYPIEDMPCSAIITEPTKLDKLYFELVELTDCKSWVNEDLKITITKNFPNLPGRGYVPISDMKNILFQSGAVDANEKSKHTRISFYWNQKVLGKTDDETSFTRLDLAIDADAEGDNEYNERADKKIFCRWMQTGYINEDILYEWIENYVKRYVANYRDPMPLVSFQLELKDLLLKTGEYIKLSTDELCDIHGNDLQARAQIVRREKKGETINITALVLPEKKIAYIAPDSTSDHDRASDTDREFGFISDVDGMMGDGETYGYHIY